MHMKPAVKLNGTSKFALVQYRLAAIAALEVALDAVREVTPHGRDYPNTEALMAAYPVYYSYRDRIQGVINDLTDEATYIDQQGD